MECAVLRCQRPEGTLGPLTRRSSAELVRDLACIWSLLASTPGLTTASDAALLARVEQLVSPHVALLSGTLHGLLEEPDMLRMLASSPRAGLEDMALQLVAAVEEGEGEDSPALGGPDESSSRKLQEVQQQGAAPRGQQQVLAPPQRRLSQQAELAQLQNSAQEAEQAQPHEVLMQQGQQGQGGPVCDVDVRRSDTPSHCLGTLPTSPYGDEGSGGAPTRSGSEEPEGSPSTADENGCSSGERWTEQLASETGQISGPPKQGDAGRPQPAAPTAGRAGAWPCRPASPGLCGPQTLTPQGATGV